MTHIAIIGVGYVGLVTGACLAEMGYFVTCIDHDKEKISLLEQGTIPFYEPGLKELTKRNQEAKRLFFSGEYKGIQKSDICFIAVGTPEGEKGEADLSQLEAVSLQIAKHLRGYTVIVNKSTAPVGTVKRLQKTMEEHAMEGVLFDVVSCPEFLKEGTAIEDCMKPDRIILGSESDKATRLLKRLYAPFNMNHDRIIVMDSASAELTKYAANAMLATRISFMNALSWLSEALGADIHAIRRGIGTDHRIGYDFLYAGAGYGGSCFPKDLRALASLSKRCHCDASLLDAVEAINAAQKKRLFQKMEEHFAGKGGIKGKTIALWGLSFKPNTDDMREAPSLVLIASLLEKGAVLRLYDPVAMPKAKKILPKHPHLQFCKSEYQAAEKADAIALVTEWKQFRSLQLSHILSAMQGNAFFDGRNQYSPTEMVQLGFDYFGIGVPKPFSIPCKKSHQYEHETQTEQTVSALVD